MTIPDPSYITVDELKANTLITALAALEDADITKLIQRAEGQLDTFVGRQKHNPDDTNTDRVFPREMDFDCNGDPIIPLQVSQACLAQVEWLYTQWWANRTTSQPAVQRTVESEQIGGDGSYSATYANSGMTLADNLLCDQAKLYLDGFVNRFTSLSVTDPDDVPSPT